MGMLNTIKGWLNIGGVRVKIQDVNPMVSKAGNRITGKVALTSKGDKQVVSVAYKFVLRRTSGRGEERKSKDYVLAQSRRDEPFDIKKGETKVLDFAIPYALEKSLKDMSGVLGAIGKIGAFAVKERDEYFVTAECGVKGTAFSPSARLPVTIVD